MKKIGLVYKTKKGNELFEINGKLYIIVKRPSDEIGQNGNYSEKEVLEIKREATNSFSKWKGADFYERTRNYEKIRRINKRRN